nr:unnamed protein product [Digitaria exilis]
MLEGARCRRRLDGGVRAVRWWRSVDGVGQRRRWRGNGPVARLKPILCQGGRSRTWPDGALHRPGARASGAKGPGTRHGRLAQWCGGGGASAQAVELRGRQQRAGV